MKIILDANAFLEDIRMAHNDFANLFDYVRRTKSTLVIPGIVMDECLGKLKRTLEEKISGVDRAIADLTKGNLVHGKWGRPDEGRLGKAEREHPC